MTGHASTRSVGGLKKDLHGLFGDRISSLEALHSCDYFGNPRASDVCLRLVSETWLNYIE